MKLTENLQKLLPFGYLFLVVLGIVKESIFYYQFGINILKYSSIMDILISPIADLTSHPLILVAFIIFIIFLYTVLIYLSKNYQKEWVRKLVGSKKPLKDVDLEEVQQYFGRAFVLMFAFGLLSFFLGIGLGSGKAIAEKISEKNLKYSYIFTYSANNESKEVFLIGSNSSNFFYVEKGNFNVRIASVSSIKNIELINKSNEKTEVK